MRRFLALVLLLSLGLAADYYPHAVGTLWRYSSGEVQRIAGRKVVAGVEVYELEHRYPEGGRMVESLSFDQGVRLLAVLADGRLRLYQPPLLLYPSPPLAVGQVWQATTKLDGQPLKVRYQVLGVEGVRVPYGAFNAFKIRSVMTAPSGVENQVDLYFVPGLGVVRFATPSGGVIDLVAFEHP